MPKFVIVTCVVLIMANTEISKSTAENVQEVTDQAFGEDVAFLQSHVKTIVLQGENTPAQVAVVPAYQGRVMTSSATGDEGTSFGWINYSQVAADDLASQINVYGGEERFWLGPEGGQYSIFFAPQTKFEFANWQTPAVIDTAAYKVVEQSPEQVTFRHETQITNYSGTEFQLRIDRRVELITSTDLLSNTKADVQWVGYRTVNQLTNTGESDWTKESGLLSIWLLGMYKHGPQTTVVIPFKQGPESVAGPIVNDTYFGKVPQDRLQVGDGVLFFSGDGKYRSKIGLTPQRSTNVCGSFDAARSVLTIIRFNQPGPEVTEYVNSMWEIQDQPFAGDAINSYNDGPAEPGAKPLGPFYELETSSPALALKSGEAGKHIQETYHIQGPREQLNQIAEQFLGVSLEQIENALQ